MGSRFSSLFRPSRRVKRLVAVDETVLKVNGSSLFLSELITLFISGYIFDSGLAGLYASALAGGYLSHLVLDFVTYEGVPWFWPLDEKYSLGLGPAGGLFVGPLGFLALVLSFYLLADRFMVAIVFLPKIG
jgi:membrane-bound metal-dependent hydrolase YbcI (DUF457 family)